MSHQSGLADFFSGFFVGAALGAVAALLLAPKSGKELRREIADEGRKLREKAQGGFAELEERGKELYRRVGTVTPEEELGVEVGVES